MDATKKVIKKQENIKIVIGFVVIFLVTSFMCWFCYINEPIGDDVLFGCENFLSFYLDDYDLNSVLGGRITTLHQVFSSLCDIYMYWSGRLTGYSLEVIGKLFPRAVQAMITVFLFAGNIILAMRIVYKDIKEVIKNPIIFVILYLALYWYRAKAYFAYMWIMTTVYSFGVFFCLLYYNLTVVNDKKGKKSNIIILQIVGLLAGLSHEVISFCVFVPILVYYLISIKRHNKTWKSVFEHTGFGIGYLLDFLAPGNFYRMNLKNEEIKLSYFSRLRSSVDIHMKVINGTVGGNILSVVVMIIFFLTLVYIVKKDKTSLKILFADEWLVFFSAFLSIVVWAFFPRAVEYGMEQFILFYYLIQIYIIHEFFSNYLNHRFDILFSCLSILLIGGLSMIHFGEIKEYYNTSYERKTLIENAVKNKKDEVVVPAYSDSLNNERINLHYLNYQKEYDSKYYKSYYGIRIIIDE